MEIEQAIRTRRTHKVFGSEPLSSDLIRSLIELACMAPNHNLTQPWRFRVLGQQALDALKVASGPEAAAKLDRAPTLIVCSYLVDSDPRVAEEDRDAAAAAAYGLLLSAHARGYATYWRTPAVLLTDQGKSAVSVPANEDVLGLLHLGPLRQEARQPERKPVDQVLSFLN